MNEHDLRNIYLAYLDCLNRQAWDELGNFVADNAQHNGRPFGLSGYRAMLINDFRTIPNLSFNAQIIVSEPPLISARLTFQCSPQGTFLGLPVNGRAVSFCEHAIYQFEQSKIRTVWSILDKAEIERQL
jgi:predicted ester cyclase